MTATEIYQQTVKPLTVAERLQLAAMILNDIPPQSMPDYKTEWSDDDLAEFSKQTWERRVRIGGLNPGHLDIPHPNP